ncbi:MAG: ABC transporter substrate-binding protein [Scytonema hyalinum WJT4-NPBG1]|nr:ABC transporter substrate-binding protein [Scytonema hyalinum WJT4-NPBG1]
MQRNDRVAIVAIAGMGGLGKTELAIQYAKQYVEFYTGGVCWLQAKEFNLDKQIVEFVQIYLNTSVPQELLSEPITTEQKIAWCWQHWQPPGQVLLVLDDVIDLSSCREILPRDNRFRVLVTTRLRQIDPSFFELSLDVLSLKASLELLTALIGKNRINYQRNFAEELCKWLGCLPLGLELIGRYLAEDPDLSVAEILKRLETQRLQDEAIELDEQQRRKNYSLMTAQRSVRAAFELSWEQLTSYASQVAQLLGFFSPNVIPWELVESTAKQLNWTEQNLKDARKQLYKLHLIQPAGEACYKIHPLIKEFLKDKSTKSENEIFKKAFMASIMPVDDQTTESSTNQPFPVITPVVPPSETVSPTVPVEQPSTPQASSLPSSFPPQLPAWRVFLVRGIFLAAIGAFALVIAKLISPPPLPNNYFTRGEEPLINQGIKSNNLLCQQAFEKKNQGMRAFANKQFSLAEENFQDAIKLFKQTNFKCSVDPETLIFLNNAKANNQGNPLTIAAIVPMNGSEQFNKLSEQMLRGVAHVQDKFNQSKGIQGRLLQVIIAKDDNQAEKGKRVAKHLGENNIPGDTNFRGEVLGVVGHFTSDVTLPSGKVYESERLVAVSPVSTAVRQSNSSPSGYKFDLSPYVFRTAPTDSVAVEKLFQYSQIIPGSGQPAIIYNSEQLYSLSLKEEFERKFGSKRVISCDLSPKSSVDTCISQTKNAKFRMLDLGSGRTTEVLLAIERNRNKLPLLGGDALYSDDKLPSDFGDRSENMVLAVASHIELFSKSFKEESKTLWGTQYVGWRTASAYDASGAIVEGLRKNPTRSGLFDALSSRDFSAEGATAKVQFDELHDRKIAPEDNHKIGVLVQVKKQCIPNDKKMYRFCLLKGY